MGLTQRQRPEAVQRLDRSGVLRRCVWGDLRCCIRWAGRVRTRRSGRSESLRRAGVGGQGRAIASAVAPASDRRPPWRRRDRPDPSGRLPHLAIEFAQEHAPPGRLRSRLLGDASGRGNPTAPNRPKQKREPGLSVQRGCSCFVEAAGTGGLQGAPRCRPSERWLGQRPRACFSGKAAVSTATAVAAPFTRTHKRAARSEQG
jgi:hypothetical protein